MESTSPATQSGSNKMFKVIVVAVIFVVAVGVAFLAGNKLSKDAAEPTSLLVVRGNVLISGTGSTIEVSEPEITWFSEHPQRSVGHFAPDELASEWESFGFASDPPNSAISLNDAIFELSEPVFDADSNVLSFNAKTISGTLEDGMKGELSIFVDAIPTTVNGQLTDYAPWYSFQCNVTVEGHPYYFAGSSQPTYGNDDLGECSTWEGIYTTLIEAVDDVPADQFTLSGTKPGRYEFQLKYDIAGLAPEYYCQGIKEGNSLADGTLTLYQSNCEPSSSSSSGQFPEFGFSSSTGSTRYEMDP